MSTNAIILNVALEPRLAQAELGRVLLNYSAHARIRAEERGLPMPPEIRVVKGMIVEAEIDGLQLSKVITRVPGLVVGVDVVFVLIPERRTSGIWFVKSIYANDVNDLHATLDLGRITRGHE